MNSDALDDDLTTDSELTDMNLLDDDETENDDRSSVTISDIDARRKLEDKLEELRLLRDLKEFDFDF